MSDLKQAVKEYGDAVTELAEVTAALAAQTSKNWEQIVRSGQVIKSLADEIELYGREAQRQRDSLQGGSRRRIKRPQEL